MLRNNSRWFFQRLSRSSSSSSSSTGFGKDSGERDIIATALSETMAAYLLRKKGKDERKLLRIESIKNGKARRSQIQKKMLADKVNSMSEDERAARAVRIRQQNQEARARLSQAQETGLKVCIDLSFESLHSSVDLRSLMKQINLSYSLNKKAQAPVDLHLTSLTEGTRFYQDFQKMGAIHWSYISVHSKKPWEVFPKEKIVLLSPDASEVLQELSHDKVYVVCGIVDRMVISSISLETALKAGVEVRALPLKQHAIVKKKLILNVNNVVDIIRDCMALGGDGSAWEQSFRKNLPKRKLPHGS